MKTKTQDRLKLRFPEATRITHFTNRPTAYVIKFKLFVDNAWSWLPACAKIDNPFLPDHKIGNPLETVFESPYENPGPNQFPQIYYPLN